MYFDIMNSVCFCAASASASIRKLWTMHSCTEEPRQGDQSRATSPTGTCCGQTAEGPQQRSHGGGFTDTSGYCTLREAVLLWVVNVHVRNTDRAAVIRHD